LEYERGGLRYLVQRVFIVVDRHAALGVDELDALVDRVIFARGGGHDFVTRLPQPRFVEAPLERGNERSVRVGPWCALGKMPDDGRWAERIENKRSLDGVERLFWSPAHFE
jgi:hypothetical protein